MVDVRHAADCVHYSNGSNFAVSWAGLSWFPVWEDRSSNSLTTGRHLTLLRIQSWAEKRCQVISFGLSEFEHGLVRWVFIAAQRNLFRVTAGADSPEIYLALDTSQIRLWMELRMTGGDPWWRLRIFLQMRIFLSYFWHTCYYTNILEMSACAASRVWGFESSLWAGTADDWWAEHPR